MLLSIVKRELLIASRHWHNFTNQLLFFLITLSIFSISFNSLNNLHLYQQTSVIAIWICLIFSILTGAKHSFEEDFQDGTIEQLLINQHIFGLIVAAKIFANWFIYCLPIVIMIPIIALLSGFNTDIIIPLSIIALIVSLIINNIINFGIILTLSANSGQSLLVILTLPLLIPIIIFANGFLLSFQSSFAPIDFQFTIKLLLAILILTVPIFVFASTTALKMNFD